MTNTDIAQSRFFNWATAATAARLVSTCNASKIGRLRQRPRRDLKRHLPLRRRQQLHTAAGERTSSDREPNQWCLRQGAPSPNPGDHALALPASDGSNPAGHLQMHVLAAVAEFE